MKSGKRQLTDGWNSQIKTILERLVKEEIYKYLSILEADIIKQVEMKEKINKDYLRRTRKLLKTKLCCRNLIKGIDTWTVPLVRYSGPEKNLSKWNKEQEN